MKYILSRSKLLPEEDIGNDEDYNFGAEILDYINPEEEVYS
jgi:hypothetical protein